MLHGVKMKKLTSVPLRNINDPSRNSPTHRSRVRQDLVSTLRHVRVWLAVHGVTTSVQYIVPRLPEVV